MSMVRTPDKNVKVEPIAVSASRSVQAAATAIGAGIDCLGYDSVDILVLIKSAATGTTASLFIQESDDNSTFTTLQDSTGSDITIDLAEAVTDPAGEIERFSVDCRLTKRYLRLAYTSAVDVFEAAALAMKYGYVRLPLDSDGADNNAVIDNQALYGA